MFLVTEITQEVEKGIVKNEILECYMLIMTSVRVGSSLYIFTIDKLSKILRIGK